MGIQRQQKEGTQMSENNKYGEPWSQETIGHPEEHHEGCVEFVPDYEEITDCNGRVVCHTQEPDTRIPDCINACAYMDDPQKEITELRDKVDDYAITINELFDKKEHFKIKHKVVLREVAELRDKMTRLEKFAEEAMGAMDVAQAYIRKGDIGIFTKQDALEELDILLKENPTNMEKMPKALEVGE